MSPREGIPVASPGEVNSKALTWDERHPSYFNSQMETAGTLLASRQIATRFGDLDEDFFDFFNVPLGKNLTADTLRALAACYRRYHLVRRST